MTCSSTMVHFNEDKFFLVKIRQETVRLDSHEQWVNIYGDRLVDVSLLVTDAQLQILGDAIAERLRKIAPRMQAAKVEAPA